MLGVPKQCVLQRYGISTSKKQWYLQRFVCVNSEQNTALVSNASAIYSFLPLKKALLFGGFCQTCTPNISFFSGVPFQALPISCSKLRCKTKWCFQPYCDGPNFQKTCVFSAEEPQEKFRGMFLGHIFVFGPLRQTQILASKAQIF